LLIRSRIALVQPASHMTSTQLRYGDCDSIFQRPESLSFWLPEIQVSGIVFANSLGL